MNNTFVAVLVGLLGAEAPRGLEPAAGRWSLFWTWWSALLRYLTLLVWPLDLRILHDLPLANGPWTLRVTAGFAICALLLWGAWRSRRRSPALAFGIVALLVGLAPLSNFAVPVSAQGGAAFPFAERYLYFPSVGFRVPTGAASGSPWRRRARW